MAELRIHQSKRYNSTHNEKVNPLIVIDSIKEPLLLDDCRSREDFGHISVSSKIIEEAKRHNTKTFRVV